MVTINEIPFKNRRNHVLLHSLWFGDKKPEPVTFLQPFVNELNELSTEGITWVYQGKTVKSKVYTTVCVCDAPARAMVQNFQQYNAVCGCGFCNIFGRRIEKGRGGATVFPYGEF